MSLIWLEGKRSPSRERCTGRFGVSVAEAAALVKADAFSRSARRLPALQGGGDDGAPRRPPPMPRGSFAALADADVFTRPDPPGAKDIAGDTRPAQPPRFLWTDPEREARDRARRARASRSPSPARSDSSGASTATPVMKDVWVHKQWVPSGLLPEDERDVAVSPLKMPPRSPLRYS